MYHLLAVLTVCIWGTTFVSTKVLLGAGMTPTNIFCLRFALAYVGMALICHRQWFCRNWRDEAAMLIAGMTGGSLYFWAENTALCYARAGTVSLIVCLAPLFTALFAFFLGRQKGMRPQMWLWTLVALGGVGLVVSGERSAAAAHPLLGGGLSLVASLSWACYQLIIKRLGDRYGAAMLTRKVFGYGLVSILLFHAVVAPQELTAGGTVLGLTGELLQRPTVWANLLFLGLVASLACYFVWSKVVEKLGAVASANYIYLNPLSTCIFSALFLGEHLTLTMGVGGLAIIAGLYMAVRR